MKRSIAMGRITFITGFPSPLSSQLARLALDREGQVALLVAEGDERKAINFQQSLGEASPHLSILTGDVVAMDLGLSGKEYSQLCERVDVIHHVASLTDPHARLEVARRANVDGTRGILDLAQDAGRISRIAYYSSAFICGDRSGVILEEELTAGQSFRSYAEQTRYETERLLRSVMAKVPISVFRPSLMVGLASTGEIHGLTSPAQLIRLAMTTPLAALIPLLGAGDWPVNLVPTDFVAQAGYTLARDPQAAGKTFHLVDPSPLSARRFIELVCETLGKEPPQPSAYARPLGLLLTPLLGRLSFTADSLDGMGAMVFFNCMNALSLLQGHGLHCPPLPSFLPRLIDGVRAYLEAHASQAQGKAPESEVPDSLV